MILQNVSDFWDHCENWFCYGRQLERDGKMNTEDPVKDRKTEDVVFFICPSAHKFGTFSFVSFLFLAFQFFKKIKWIIKDCLILIFWLFKFISLVDLRVLNLIKNILNQIQRPLFISFSFYLVLRTLVTIYWISCF